MVIKNCAYCGQSFTTYRPERAKYCSVKCKNESQKAKKEIKVCLFCGKTFEIVPSKNSRKFCSRRCAYEAHKEAGNPNWKGGEELFTCEQCGNEFSRPRAEANSRNDIRFCSTKCHGVWQSKHLRGRHSWSWQGGITPKHIALRRTPEWKEAVRCIWLRDKARCQRCGKYAGKRGGKKFHIHHIVPFADDQSIACKKDNLILLCSECHTWVHSNANKTGSFLAETLTKAKKQLLAIGSMR